MSWDQLMWGVAELVEQDPVRFRVTRYADKRAATAATMRVGPVYIPGGGGGQPVSPLVCREESQPSDWVFEATGGPCPR